MGNYLLLFRGLDGWKLLWVFIRLQIIIETLLFYGGCFKMFQERGLNGNDVEAF